MIARPTAFYLGALASGLLFGLGLAISGMIYPAKVKAFLDIGAIATGGWDPSLAFVLASAVLVSMAAIRIAHRHRHPIAASTFSGPAARRVDAPLVLGSVLFGVGWGLSGLCPGPAIANIAFALPDILIFLVAMAIGALAVRLVRSRSNPGDSRTQAPS
ncbi:DUF6691 family protein [Kaistia defluvii]|uniref:Membrane protein YedE/YeeE n=1 Tax=Kaistia defluvii TaxID=410841 RepID=A0ABV2QVJ8_9HYPH